MKAYLIIIGVVLLASSAHAQTFRVKKVKGNRAVIELPKGVTLDEGSKYSIDASGVKEEMSLGDGSGTCAHTLGLEFVFSSTSVETKTAIATSKTNTSDFNVLGMYGWNTGQMEYGPILGLDWDKTGSTSTRTFSLGGFFDYNLIPNKVGTDLVYGVGGVLSLEFGSSDNSIGSSSSTNGYEFRAGPFLKWFGLGSSTCVRGDAVLDYDHTKTSTRETTETGIKLLAGLQTYF
jgi:hypothetical protein